MMKEKRSPNRLKRVMKSTIRALVKARDLYVDAMKTYSNTAFYGATLSSSFILPVADPLPRSFSTPNPDLDLKDLIRDSSKTRIGSVGMAKIDEDEPCQVGEAMKMKMKMKMKKRGMGLFSRSKSYA